MADPSSETAELVRRIAEEALRRGVRLAVAESLTAGNIAAALGAAPDSARWFAGGVVAYSERVKQDVLGMPDVAVVSAEAAAAMAAGVRDLLAVDFAVAVTGVGGPGAQDGEPAGSVWFATASESGVTTWHHHFDADPVRVVARTVRCALAGMAKALDAGPADGGADSTER